MGINLTTVVSLYRYDRHHDNPICRMNILSIDNIFAKFDGHGSKQAVGIHMVTNWVLTLADLFVYSHEVDC